MSFPEIFRFQKSIENDANLAGLNALKIKSPKYSTLTLSTGIGSGIITDEKLINPKMVRLAEFQLNLIGKFPEESGRFCKHRSNFPAFTENIEYKQSLTLKLYRDVIY